MGLTRDLPLNTSLLHFRGYDTRPSLNTSLLHLRGSDTRPSLNTSLLHLRGSDTRPALNIIPQWGGAETEIKVPSGENTELKRSPSLKLGVGQYIAIRATLTARDLFLAYFCTSLHSPAFFQNLSRFFLCWLWLTQVLCTPAQ